MENQNEYLFETFNAESSSFDSDFTNYLNKKQGENWSVKNCSFCHGNDGKRLWASCLFAKA